MKISRSVLHKTLAYYAAYVAFGLLVAAQGPALPDLADQTDSRLSQMGLLLAVRALGYLIGIQGLGRLYDRVPGHPVMGGVLLMVIVGLFLTPLIPLLPLLMVVFFCLGVGESGLDVGGNTMLVWLHGEKSAPLLNGLHFCFGAGAFICPTLLEWAGDLRTGYWLLALLAVPPAVLLFTSSSPPIRRTQVEAGEVVNLRLVVLITLFFFLHVGAELSFGNWIYTYLTRLDVMNKQNASYLTSAYWGAITAGRLLSLPLAVRLKPHVVLLGDVLGCLLSVAIIAAWDGAVGAVVGTLGFGLSLATLFPSTLAFAGERMTLTGKISGWFFSGNALAGIILPAIIGRLFEDVGEETLIWVVGLCFVIALGVYNLMRAYPPQTLHLREAEAA